LLADRYLHRAEIGHHGTVGECRPPAERLPDARGVVRQHGGRAEIVGESLALLLGGRVQQPHQQEERHHGGDEVGIRDFPRAAVSFALDHLLPADEDAALGLSFRLAAHAPAVSATGAA
jgi:hypothetical protein